MGILKNQPVLLRIANSLLYFVGLPAGSEIDGVSAIFGALQNTRHRSVIPAIEFGILVTIISALRQSVSRRIQHIFLRENTGDFRWSVSFDAEFEYPPHHIGSFFVDHPLVFINFGRYIAVNRL